MRSIMPSLALAGAMTALAVPLVANAQSLSPSADPNAVTVEIVGQATADACAPCFPDGKSLFMGGSTWGGNDVTTDGSFYVVNAGTSEIWHTGEYAEPIARWGQNGTGPGQFNFVRDPAPADGLAYGGVAASPLGGPFGNVYVADSGNDRVQEFDHDGTFIRQFGGNGSADGQFMDPIDVAVGPSGLVYVVDDVRDDVQVFSPEGSFLMKVGSHGSATDSSTTPAPCSSARTAPSTPPTPATAASRPGVRMAPSRGRSAAPAPPTASSIAPRTSASTPQAIST